MAQATYVPNIAHDNAAALAFFQAVFEAIATNNSGATAPSETFAGMWWLDTSTTPPTLRQRNQANSGWDVFAPPSLTQEQVENAASTVFGLVSGQRLSQAVAAFVTPPATGRLLLVSSVSASGASVSITGLNTGKSYFVEFISLRCANASSQQLQIAFSSDNGSTFGADSPISASANWNSVRCRAGLYMYKPAAKVVGETCSDLSTSANSFTIQFRTLSGFGGNTNALRFRFPTGNFSEGSFNLYEVS